MEISLNSRFLNLSFSLFNKEQKKIEKKSSSDWSQVWLRCLESQYGENKLLEPYKQYPWVYIAIREIATPISQVPFLIYKGKDKLVEEGLVYDLFSRPNPYMSRYQLWEAILTLLNLDGNAYVVMFHLTNSKLPSELWVFGKNKVKILRNRETGHVVGYQVSGNKVQNFDARQVIHYKLYNPYDMIEGLSPVTVARMTAESDYAAMRYNKAVLDNDAEPGGILTPIDKDVTLSEDQIKILREQWESRHQGVDKAKRLAVIPGALKYEQTSLSPRDMQYLSARKNNREEILAIWQVPKGVVGITDDLNYATLKGQKRIFWEDTLLPQAKMIEDGLEAHFFPVCAPDHWGQFDRKAIPELQEDFESKVKSAKELYGMGFTRNEINERLDLGFQNKPWGDTWFIPMSMIPVDMAGEFRTAPAGGDGRLTLPLVKIAHPDEIRMKRWVSFLNRIDPVERKFVSKLRRFFFEQRRMILELLNKNTKDVGDVLFYIWDEQDSKIVEVSRPIYQDAIKNGFGMVAEVLVVEPMFTLNNPLAEQAILKRCTRITGINGTIKRQIRKMLEEGMVSGESIVQLSDRVKSVYNMARSRALTISRTEVVGATNEGQQLEMEAEGVEKQQWVTAGDEAVRADHEAENGNIVKLNETFPVTGLHYPGDTYGSAEQIIGCRCTTYPVID